MASDIIKGLPLPFIFTLVLQTATIVWYISSLNSAVENNTKDIIRKEARLSSVEATVQNQAVMLARIDENLKAIRLLIEDINKTSLERR